MNTNNIDSIILKAYYAIPFDQLEEISFIYLQHSIEKQLFLYTRFEEATLNRLKTIFNQAKDQFESFDDTEEPRQLVLYTTFNSTTNKTCKNQA